MGELAKALPQSIFFRNFALGNQNKLGVMDRTEIFNRIEYVVACVGAFAMRFNLSNQQAYAYLRRFSGIDFLLDCYAAEHTLSIDDAVGDLQLLCMRKGGRIV